MNEELFEKLGRHFASGGLVGSYSAKTGEIGEEPEFLFSGPEPEWELHREVYLLDPEYAFVLAFEAERPGESVPEISSREDLEEAILTKGIAHTKAFWHKDLEKIVLFGDKRRGEQVAQIGGKAQESSGTHCR